MATQRLATARSLPSAVASSHRNQSPSRLPPKPSRKNSTGVPSIGVTLQNDDGSDSRDLKRESERQNLFQTTCNKALKVPDGYVKVAVLLIRWHEDIDDYKLGHTDEINRLQSIFRDQYLFTCDVFSIDNKKRPQIALNRAILDHIDKYDDPNTLLIFYYTGHGSNENDVGLELAANQTFERTTSGHAPIALWDRAEQPIRDYMDGDALSILDCCMASRAAFKLRNGFARTYQMLAAAPADGSTRSPGKFSFTTALCESLEELLQEANSGTFPLTKLYARINKKRQTQACLTWDRLEEYKGRDIRLGRLENTKTLEDSICNELPERSSLSLRFSFDKSDLSNDQIQNFAEHLSAASYEAKLPIRRIDWMAMTTAKRELAQVHTISQDILVDAVDEVHRTMYRSLKPLSPEMVRKWRKPLNKVVALNRFIRTKKNDEGEEREGEEKVIDEALEAWKDVSSWAMIFKWSSFLSLTAPLLYRNDRLALIVWASFMMLVLLFDPSRQT